MMTYNLLEILVWHPHLLKQVKSVCFRKCMTKTLTAALSDPETETLLCGKKNTSFDIFKYLFCLKGKRCTNFFPHPAVISINRETNQTRISQYCELRGSLFHQPGLNSFHWPVWKETRSTSTQFVLWLICVCKLQADILN